MLRKLDCRLCNKAILNHVRLPNRSILNKLSSANFDLSELPKMWEIQIGVCESCRFLQLFHQIPDTEFYTEYSTPSKWKLEPQLSDIVQRIVDLCPTNGRVLDIGCNDAKLINQLAKQGIRAIGVEPSFSNFVKLEGASAEVISEFFTQRLAEEILSTHGKFDVVVSRHVIEHVGHLVDFVEGIKTLCHRNSKVVIETPLVDTFLFENDVSYWEEHVNYFSRQNLINLFAESGLRCAFWQEITYSGRTQVAVFEMATSRFIEQGDSIIDINLYERALANAVEMKNSFESFLERNNFKRLLLFGVSSRALSSLSVLQGLNLVDEFIDSNEFKISKIIPEVKKRIRSEDYLENLHSNDLVLLGMSEELQQKAVQNQRRLGNTFLSLLPPSSYFWHLQNT